MTFNLNNDVKEKENTSIYNVKELAEEGYLYDNTGIYIPYNLDPRDIYLKISRNPDKKCELIYTWVEKQNDHFKELTFFRNDKLINEEDSKFNQLLSVTGGPGGVYSCKGCYVNFAKEFKSKIINADCLEVFKVLDFEFPEVEEEPQEETEVEEEVFSFNNYPKLIQDEALQIIKDGTLYRKYVDSISITHAGNKSTKEQLALITVSLFIGEPIHTELNAESGRGKTDVTSETVKNIPDIYVHHLSTVSPKNIYYDKDSYGEFNILIFDDVVLSDENISLLKVLADNNKPVKSIKTVIDKKPVEFELEGTFLIILTYAKDNPDEELLNRLYKLNMIIKDENKSLIKNKIKQNAIINAGHNEIIFRSREIIQAAIQYLIEQDLEIFNPFAVLFDPSELANRNIGHFITMVKCKSFFHTNKLKPIQFRGKTIFIGSYADFESVAEIWLAENDTQKYKLNSTQERILEILPEKTRDEAIGDVESALNRYKPGDGKEKAEIMDELYTRETISKLVGIGKDTVRYYLDKSQGTATTLCDKGLVGRLPFDKSKTNSPLIYYKIKKEVSEDEKSAWKDWKNENSKHFNTFESKISILLSLLYLVNITVNEKGYTFLKKYCESENHSIDLNDYNSYYNFINDAITHFNFEEYAVELENTTLSDLTYMIEHFEKLNTAGEKNEGPLQDQDSEDFSKQEKSDDSAQNPDSTSFSYGNQDFPYASKQQDISEIFDSSIDDPNYAAKICELLVHQDLTHEAIFNELHPDVLLDPKLAFEYHIDFSETLLKLKKAGYVSENKNTDDITYYHLNEDIKKKLN